MGGKGNRGGIRMILVLVVAVLASGCGYGFRGSVNNLPPDIKAVHIPIFVNQTNEAGAETIFANALIYEFNRSHILQVVAAAEAQVVIIGKIKSVAIETVTLASQTQAVDRKVTIVLDVTCQRLDNKKILWQNPALSRYQNYTVSQDHQFLSDRSKEEAIRKIAQDLSERIHNGILENF
jgi:outer membrane lipopolysaccharide assembly protein LptE/RlpB